MKLLNNSLIYTAVSVLQKALGFFLLPVYTAYLSASDYGTANVILSVVNFLSLFYMLSLHGAGTRFEYKYQGDPEVTRTIWGTLFLFVTVNSAVLTAVFFLGRNWLLVPFLSGIPFSPYMLLGLVAVAFSPSYQLFQSNLQAKQLGRRYGLNNLCYFLVNMTLTVIFITVFAMKANGILLALAITNAIFFAYTLVDFLPRISLRFDPPRLKESFGYSLPLLPHSMAGWAMSLVDRLFLNHYRDAASVGVYSIGYQFGNLINVLTGSVNQAFVPWFFEQFELGGPGKARIARVSEVMVLAYSICALAVSLFAPEVLRFMVTAEFREGAQVVPFLAFSFVFGGIYYAFINPLFVRRTGLVPIVTLTSAVVGVGMNVWLIPRFGMLGAAASSLASMAFSSVIALVLAERFEPIGFRWARMFAYAVIPFGLSLAIFLQDRFPPIPFFFGKAVLLAAMASVCVLIYRAEAEMAWNALQAKIGRAKKTGPDG